jgi:hypothetical protein
MRVVFDNLTSTRYGLLNFHHSDVLNNAPVNGMFRGLELPTQNLDPNVLKHTHAKIILLRSPMINLAMPNRLRDVPLSVGNGNCLFCNFPCQPTERSLKSSIGGMMDILEILIFHFRWDRKMDCHVNHE